MKHSSRLLLDIPQKNDFDRYYQINSDPKNNLFNPKGPMNVEQAEKTFAEMQAHWNNHNFGTWVIKHAASKEVIGFGGLSHRMYGPELKLNLGYRFDHNFWGNGYATEVALFAIEYGFHELKVDKIYALVRPNHTASINVLEKCNMKLCGTLDDVPNQESSLVYEISK